MSITVVVRRRARPGEGTHLIVTGVHLLEERATRGEPLGIARVFQSLRDQELGGARGTVSPWAVSET